MVRQTNLTGAESCWDDEPESEAACEKYLHAHSVNRRREPIEDEEEENEDADETDTDENEQDSVEEKNPVTAEEDSDVGDDEEEDEENDEPADEESAQLKGKTMAKAKTGKTKAESIREVIAARQEAGKDLRPKDIIEALNKKGVEVNASQVSVTLRAMGVPAMRRSGPATSKPAASKPETNGEDLKSRVTAKVRAPIAAADVAVSVEAMDSLLGQAADFIHEAGGIDRARSVLEMCHKVMQRT